MSSFVNKLDVTFLYILQGFGCKLVAFDVQKNPAAEQLGVEYVSGDELFQRADIISLHCPLNKFTQHLINEDSISKMKRGVILVNTSRGGLIDTPAVIKALEDGKFAGLGIDVYENVSNNYNVYKKKLNKYQLMYMKT